MYVYVYVHYYYHFHHRFSLVSRHNFHVLPEVSTPAGPVHLDRGAWYPASAEWLAGNKMTWLVSDWISGINMYIVKYRFIYAHYYEYSRLYDYEYIKYIYIYMYIMFIYKSHKSYIR